MREHNLFRLFTDPLNKMGVTYMVTGAVASIVYGEPRLTHDIDLVVEIKSEDAKMIAESFPINEFYCPPTEVLIIESKRNVRGHFNIIHHNTGFKADFYVAGTDSLHSWALKNRKNITIEGEDFWVAPIEYVLLRKLEYYRDGGSEKHLKDIEGMVEVSRDHIDWQCLAEKIKQYKLTEQADRINLLNKKN